MGFGSLISRKSRDHARAAGHAIAHLHQNDGIERQIYFRSRAEANHPEALPFLKLVPHLRPADDSPRDHAGELPHDQRHARILEGPGHGFVLCRAIGMARIETQAFMALAINDPPSIGARFVCTSKTERKMPTRRVRALSTSVSSISTMSATTPVGGRDDRVRVRR